MIVIHIESGLGNQMLSYCEYLSLKYANPQQDFFLETIIYEIPECNEYISQWNGYELDRIFGIDSPKNIKTLFSEGEWRDIISEIKATEFWRHNWNYPVAFTNVLNRHGLHLLNMRGDFDPEGKIEGTGFQQTLDWKGRLRQTGFWVTLRRYYGRLYRDRILKRKSNQSQLFLKTDKDVFTGQWLDFKRAGNKRELIDEEIKDVFTFPRFSDAKNQEMADYMDGVNAIAIHARRGDMLGVNGWCYKHGYFRRAVKKMKGGVKDPVFVFFTNTGSIEWCKDNAEIFGLDYSRDTVFFVDWNAGNDSFRDMQLMSHCKHAIVTNSTFGWWGAYFITNPNKITISPLIDMDTTTHC